MALSGSPWHSGWARRAGGAQLREAEVQASGGPVSRPWRRTGRSWKDLADRELKPRTQRFMRRPGREPQTEDRQRAGQGPGEPASHRERRTRPGGCHPRRGDRGGWAPAGCSQPWDMREACHTELGGTRPQGPRGQPCTSVCTSQVGTGVGEAGALCRPPRGTPQGGTWSPSSRPGS